jgi:hypothetical protein
MFKYVCTPCGLLHKGTEFSNIGTVAAKNYYLNSKIGAKLQKMRVTPV